MPRGYLDHTTKAPPPVQSATFHNQQLQQARVGAETASDIAQRAETFAQRKWYQFAWDDLQNISGPKPENWDKMTPDEKFIYKGKAFSKTVGGFVKKLPRSILKAPLRVGQTAYDISVGARAIIDKNRTMEDIYKQEGVGRGYTLPWLGEVRGYAGSYKEGQDLGLSKPMSIIKAGSETIGDLAIAYTMFSSAKTLLTSTRLSKLKGTKSFVTKDTSPAKFKETIISKFKSKIDTKSVKTYKNTGLDKQVKYVKISKDVAIKRTPIGNNKVEYSLVRVKGSISQTMKNAFAKKFGKSNVTTGKYGTEIKLQSVIKDVPITSQAPIVGAGAVTATQVTDGMTMGSATKMATEKISESQALVSVTDSTARKTAEAYQFYSPSVEENLSFVEAAKRLTSQDQARYKIIGNDIDKTLGHQSESFSAIGDWSDGAENTVFNIIKNIKDFDELRYSTALKGKIGNQKSVIPFLTEEGGADVLYISELRGISMEEIRGTLDKLGLQYRTLIEGKDSTKIIVFDQGKALTNEINNLAKKYDTKIEHIEGRGEFLGSWETRAKGLQVYNKVIEEYEKLPNRKYYSPTQGRGFSNLGSQKAEGTITSQEKRIIPSLMARPLKGFGDSVVTNKQIGQIVRLSKDRQLPNEVLQATVKIMTGKNHLSDLNQDEAYRVSETVRAFSDEVSPIPDYDKMFMIRPWITRMRDWSSLAEKVTGAKVYSEVFMPMELATREYKIFTDKWKLKARKIVGKHARKTEEMRLVDNYVRGDKGVILKNKTLSKIQKKELSDIGDWFIDTYKEMYIIMKKIYGEDLDLGEFFGEYGPTIKKLGGIYDRYKSSDLPAPIKPFFSFKRSGMLSPVEDNALALFDIYIGAAGKQLFLAQPVENAKEVIDDAPYWVKKGALSYLQEKLGYEDQVMRLLNKFGERMNKISKGKIPKNASKQSVDALISASYAAAIGGRPMPIVRNMMQSPMMNFSEFGARWYGYGLKKSLDPKAIQEVRGAGFLVQRGVPYGSEIMAREGKGPGGKAVDFYKRINAATLIPYAGIDVINRVQVYFATKGRFEENWELLKNGKISNEEFEKNINIDGFNPVLRDMLREKFVSGIKGNKKAVKEALDMMIQDKIDDTQFPYRKGSEGRMHYGLGGKTAFQFTQWMFEYVQTLGKWIARGQWDKLIRWYATSTAIKRTAEDVFGVDVSKWVAMGPMGGFGFGPIGKMISTGIGSISSAMNSIDGDVNKAWQDIARTMTLYGGILTGVQSQRLQNFKRSVDRYESGNNPSPYPDKPFMLYAKNSGKAIRFVSFSELLKITMGFVPEEASKQSERINIMKRNAGDKVTQKNKAMNAFMDGDYEKFNRLVEKYNIPISSIKQSLKSYREELDKRIFDRLPMDLKIKYINSMYPID